LFVIKINGALTTSTYSKVILTNGTQSKNVYWMIEGAVSINNYSVFRGTIICHNGALGALNTGVELDGRALTTSGSLTTNAIATTMTPVCKSTGTASLDAGKTDKEILFYPNPFTSSLNITINEESQLKNCEVRIYNILGEQVIQRIITKQTTTLETGTLRTGLYFYKAIDNGKTIQSGKLISR